MFAVPSLECAVEQYGARPLGAALDALQAIDACPLEEAGSSTSAAMTAASSEAVELGHSRPSIL